MVKNVYGRDKLERNPVDRGRKGSKITVVVDHHGIVHSLYSCGANISDMKLLGVVLKYPLHKPLVKRIELYADKGYDSKCNRHLCTGHGLFDPIKLDPGCLRHRSLKGGLCPM